MKLKLTLVLILSILVNSTMLSQELTKRQQRIQQREAKHELGGKENNMFFTLSTGYSNHNQVLITSRIEYSRNFSGNWFWGVTLQENLGVGRATVYDWDGTGKSPYRNTVRQNISITSGMLYYRIPVIKSRLFLRPGIGVGLGIHQLHDHEDNSDLLVDSVLPYFSAELTWILRLSRSIELKFAPTILGIPQSVSVSPMQLGEPTDVYPLVTEIGISIGLGVRF